MSKNYLPYKFASYQGTRWHRRLVSGEFILQFDQYPEREVIIDHIADLLPENKAWKDRIRTICTKDSQTWNQTSPGELIEQLRKERSQYIPVTRPHWQSSSFPPLTRNDCLGKQNNISNANNAILSADVQTLPVFVFPDIYDECPLDEQIAILITRFRAHGTELLNFNNHEHITDTNENTVIVCIPEAHNELEQAIRHYPVKFMPDPTGLKVALMTEMGKARAIVCSDVWYTLAFLKVGIPVHSFLDRRDWFTSVVLRENIPDNNPTNIPAQTRYGELLHSEMEKDRDLREYRYLDGMPSNGVEANLEEDVAIPQWVEQATKENNLILSEGFYQKAEGNTWIRTEAANANTVQVAIVMFDKGRVMMEPVFFAGKHSPLSLSYPDGGFFTSFNYYFTENLKSWYANSDKRTIPWDDFMLDYLAFSQEDGFYESVPLYNKALLGYARDGTLFACDGEWESITLTLDEDKIFIFNKELPLSKGEIKEQNNTFGAQKRTTGKIHFPTDNTWIGEGHWCLTFIHDFLWNASEGPVQVPPFGVVVTIDEKIEKVEKASWSVNWKNLPIDKSEVVWLAGGFNLLIKDRKNLVKTKEETLSQLEKEGWFLPASLMTQETALDVAGVQPRSVIGYSGEKIVVMSVTGRNKKSQGITFTDVASLAMHMTKEMKVGPLEFLLNLDGGASSVLGCKKDGEVPCLLTKPSPSITNPAGCPRCVPSLLTIKLKSYREKTTTTS